MFLQEKESYLKVSVLASQNLNYLFAINELLWTDYFQLTIVLNLCYHPDFYYYHIWYTVVIPYATISNSTVSLIIPPDFFAFKIYSRLSNSPALWVWYSRVWHRP